MVYLPTFLSFPWSFPSLPPISLPANIQRRFLSYVLKRTLGRYVRAGGLDVDRIQAQISEGWVEVEGLEVDEGEINSLIPASVPLSLSSGTLSKVTARIPFPNLWSAPLSITLDTLTLDFTLSSHSPKGKAPETPRRQRTTTQTQSPTLDLTASVTTAADEFLHDELDAYQEAELDRSIRESLVLSQTDPFVGDDLPGSFPPTGDEGSGSTPLSPGGVESTTVLAGIIERVLARLDLKVKNIKIRLHHLDPNHGAVFELRVKEIQYIDETVPQDGEVRSTVRVVKVSGVEVFTLSTNSQRPTTRPESLARSSSSCSTVSTSTTESGNGDMMMSLAVADLRQSMAASSIAGESVYESALSEQEEEPPRQSPRMEMKRSLERIDRSTTPKAPEVDVVDEPELLLSFGSEDVVLRMTTTRPFGIPVPTPGSGASAATIDGSLPSAEIRVSAGTISCLFTPSKLGSILSALQAGTAGLPNDPSPAVSPEPSQTIQPRLDILLRVDHVFTAVIYDMDPAPSSELDAGIKRFWASPGTTYLPVGHLKLRIDAIGTSYSFPGFTPPNRQTPRTRSKPPSRPPNPTLSLSITDISLFEYLASAQTDSGATPGGIFPVLLFDPGLNKQYDLPPGPVSTSSNGGLAGIGTSEATFPGYDTFDWRDVHYQRKGQSEKLWKVRPKGRGALKNAPSVVEDTGPVLVVRKELSETSSASVHLNPLHIFLDLSLIERLLPMLRQIAPAMRRPRSTASSPTATTPLSPRTPRPLHSVIEDLEAPPARQEVTKVEIAVISCPILRLDIRCPAPPAKRGTWGDASSLRSGIVTLDIHDVTARLGGPHPTAPPSNQGKVESLGKVDCQKAIVFFCRAPEKRSSAFFVIGPLGPEPGDSPSDVLLPSIDITSSIDPRKAIKTQRVVCRVPCVQSQIRQSTIEGLQFFADDITHWLDGAFGDGSRPRPRDELKMIGSRFFGSKGSSSASSSVLEESEDEGSAATVLQVIVSEFDTRLHVPRASNSRSPSSEAEAHDPGQRIFSLRASDIDTKIESNVSGRQETGFTISILDAEFSDRSDLTHSQRIFGRTTPPTLTLPTPPLIHCHFYTLTDPTGAKESGLKLSLSSGTISIFDDLGWTRDLAAFAKTPEGVFEDVVPSEITRINVVLADTSVNVKAPKEAGAVVLVLGSGVFRTDLVSGADDGVMEIGVSGRVLAVDDVSAVGHLQGGHASSYEAWKAAGWASLVECMLDARVFRDFTGAQGVLLDVIQSQVSVTACADSLATVGELVADIGTMFASPPATQEIAQTPVALDQSIDVFASVDEEAFHRMPELTSGVDMIEDDLPTNMEYLDETTSRPTKSSPSRRDTESDLVASALESSILEVSRPQDAATIRILMDEPFEAEQNYWSNLPVVSGAGDEDTAVGKIRVRVQDTSVSVYLHEGYDWQKTRKVIEDEIKAVRRKLEKIRQLLASGQKADEPLTQGHSVLFNSVYIGLDEQKEDLDSAALLAAIDEELDGLATAETASQSSWQTDFPPTQARRDKTHRTRLRGKRLTRSKKAQIEISLLGIRADLDIYDPGAPTASRVGITIGSMEILDHIKTSTWKKFLTEMKSDGRGNMRETGADMVRIELTAVRPSLGPSKARADGQSSGVGEESRLKAKILPLRLHVDQDALDFFKRFFSFSTAKNPKPAGASNAGPFFQHVEIFAIELKLDYKPKRVDLAALREGRTIELMNFFHFDGAEMTLRHITLSGITGWNRLTTTLQDIWTPDVKANQLADVISGVSPIRSLVNVGSGVADLILLPIEQYRKDGRVTRGVQRGTSSFVRSTAMEMMKLGARLATGTQVVLEKAEGALGGGKLPEIEVTDQIPVRATDAEESDEDGFVGEEGRVARTSRYANQPLGAKEGVQAAYKSLSKNVNAAAQTILAVPMEVYERSGPGEDGPLKAVVRAVPIAVLKPMIGASEAVSKTLLGVRNSLDPQSKRDIGDKYK